MIQRLCLVTVHKLVSWITVRIVLRPGPGKSVKTMHAQLMGMSLTGEDQDFSDDLRIEICEKRGAARRQVRVGLPSVQCK